MPWEPAVGALPIDSFPGPEPVPVTAPRQSRAGDDDPVEPFLRAARELFALNPDATPAELDEALAREVGRYNARPQRALGGLSPQRVERLLDDPWDGTGVIRLREHLPAAELEATPFLHDALALLARVAAEPPKLTSAGNLPRAFVAAHRAAMRMAERLPGEFDMGRNEQDLFPLHHLRILLQATGLLRRWRGTLRLSRAAERLLDPARRGPLFAHLFRGWFRSLNLAYVDGAPEAPAFQGAIAFTLYRFHDLAADWRTTGQLAADCLLPIVRSQLPVRRSTDPTGYSYEYDEARTPLECRFLHPLVDFGLAEVDPPADPLDFRGWRWRKTGLLDRFVRFEW